MIFWKWIDTLEGGMASIGAGLCLFLIMMITVASVFGRYVLGVDLIPGGYNMIESIAFPLLVFLAAPLGHRQGMFPRFEMLADRLPARVTAYLALLVAVVELGVFSVLLWYLGQFAWDAVESARQAQIGTQLWPVWPVILVMPLGFALIWLEIVRQAWKASNQCFRSERQTHDQTEQKHS